MNRPFVYFNMAATADGKITSATREYPRFTSRVDRKNMDLLRARADAILIGAGTMRADNPPLNVRDDEMKALRHELGKPPGLIRVLVSASLDLPEPSRFFDEEDGGTRIIATVESAPEDRVKRMAARAELWRTGTDEVDLPAVLRRLKEERGVERLLVEGGGELNWRLVRDDLVDELHVTVAPALLGGRDAPTLLEGDGLRMKDRRRLKLLDVRREGDELYCRWAVERKA